MNNAALQNLKERRSIRKYKPEPITEAELDAVLEAGTYAPTGMGWQSPLMVAVTNQEDVAALSRMNAAVMGRDGDPFYGAKTVIIVFADADKGTGVEDATLVMGNLLNAAHAVGLGSCWVNRAKEVFDTDEGKALLAKWGITGNWTGVGHCILGYPDETPTAAPRKEGYVVKVK
jgi:nitroreductase